MSHVRHAGGFLVLDALGVVVQASALPLFPFSFPVAVFPKLTAGSAASLRQGVFSEPVGVGFEHRRQGDPRFGCCLFTPRLIHRPVVWGEDVVKLFLAEYGVLVFCLGCR